MSKKPIVTTINALGIAAGALVAGALIVGLPLPLGQTEAAAPRDHGAAAHAEPHAEEARTTESAPAEPVADACCLAEATSDLPDHPQSAAEKLVAAEEDHDPEHAEADGHADDHGHAEADGPNHEGAFCSEHQVAEAECAICQPQLAGTLDPGESLKLRMPAASSAEMAGVLTMPAKSAVTTANNAAVLCRVNFNPTRTAHLTPLIEGVIRDVFVDLGEPVTKGQPLVQVAAPALADAKDTYLSAITDVALANDTHARTATLREKGIATEQELQEAAAGLRKAQTSEYTARQRLLDVGISAEQLEEIRAQKDTGTTIVLQAPFDGTVIEWHAIRGEAVGREESILTIADLSTMALDMSVPKVLIASAQVGTTMNVRFDELPGVSIEARIDWVSPMLDEDNRTVKARAIVTNPGGLLKAGMFGKASLQEGIAQSGLQLPKDAVQSYDGLPFVFVRQAADLYDVRRVSIGREDANHVEITAGLYDDEPVVVAQSFAVKSEFLKSRLGAGCTHD